MAKKKSKDRSWDVLSEIQAIQSLYDKIVDKSYSSLGISNEQFNVLDILASSDKGLALNQIQVLLSNQTSNTTRLVDKLQSKKLLVKKSNPTDKRRLLITITAEGGKVWSAAKELVTPLKKKFKKGLNSNGSKALLTQLKSIRKLLSAIDS
jgi:DNA-binding MarR family transcriptional regulator